MTDKEEHELRFRCLQEAQVMPSMSGASTDEIVERAMKFEDDVRGSHHARDAATVKDMRALLADS